MELLPEGSYFDENDMLRKPDGEFLDDGIYQDSHGNVILYDGIEETGRFDLVGTKG